MSYHLPPLTWLRAFEAAARAGSFTTAAEELSLTSAAVSHQIRSLESYLGYPLFERLPRSVKLTSMGRAYLPAVRRAFDELSRTTFGLFGGQGERTITIRSTASYSVLWLAPHLKSFLQAYPEIDVRLHTAIWVEALNPDETDIDIRFGDGRWPGYQVELISNDNSVVVCSPQVAAQIAAFTSLEQLQDFKCIHIMGREGRWEEYVSKLGVEIPLDLGIKVDTSLNALELAASGIGLALVQKSFAAAYLKDGRLVRPFDLELPSDESHYLLLPKGAKSSKPEALLFRDWLLAEANPERN